MIIVSILRGMATINYFATDHEAAKRWYSELLGVDLPAALQRLVSMGAKEHQPIIDRGGQGFVTASVVDPFGNILGIMTNPHYQAALKR